MNNVCTHVVLNKNIDNKFKNLFIRFRAFIDLNVFDKVFIDKIFAQNLNFELIFMKVFKIFEIFDEIFVVCDFITHYVDIYFKIFVARENVRFIRFYVIDFFHWFVVFEISWFVKNKVFLNFDKMTIEIFITFEFEFKVFNDQNIFQ